MDDGRRSVLGFTQWLECTDWFRSLLRRLRGRNSRRFDHDRAVVAQFPFDGRDIAERRVPADGVVVIDPGDNHPPCLSTRGEAVSRDELSFQRGPKRFGSCIIQAQPARSCRLTYLIAVTEPSELPRRVFAIHGGQYRVRMPVTSPPRESIAMSMADTTSSVRMWASMAKPITRHDANLTRQPGRAIPRL